MQSLYEKYGGLPTVTKIVQDFYRRINLEPALTRFFQNANMAALIDHQVAFICKALGGPDLYAGMDMRKAHARLDIDRASFALVAGILHQTLTHAGMEAGDTQAVLTTIAALEGEIVSHAA